MIRISPEASRQIHYSAEQSSIQNAIMRIAVKKLEDGSFHYALGFDDSFSPRDIRINVEKTELVIDPDSLDLARDLKIDFVELDCGEKNFIFINPADPNCSLNDTVSHSDDNG